MARQVAPPSIPPLRRPPRTGSPRGLTLVELLVVIGVISVLTGIALPLASSARKTAWRAVATSSLRQLTTANLAYAADHRGRFVPSANQLNTLRWSGKKDLSTNRFDPTKGLLADYLGKSREIVACPMLRHILDKQGKVDSFEEGGGGYGYNDYIGGAMPQRYTDDVLKLTVALRSTQVRSPTRTLMFATTALAKSGGVQEYPFCHPPFWLTPDGAISSERPSASLHFRYNGKAIVAWCDGHVSLERKDSRPDGFNPYGGDASAEALGWFGPDKDNGYWNPANDL